jgi:hypothetical protein
LLAQFIKKGRRRRLVPPAADKTDEFTPFHCHPRPSRRYRSNLGRH